MISTYSLFYFGHTVTDDNCSIDFDEGGSELQATLTHGEYTLTEYLAELKRAFDAAGALTYTVTVARATRLITIAATGTFKLRIFSGTRAGSTAYGMIGFTGADRTSAATYTGNVGSGSKFEPQYKLQDYLSPTDGQDAVDEKVNDSPSGEIEVVKFGDRRFMECNIMWATDKNPSGSPLIKLQASALANLNAFMVYCCTKAPIEYMPDIDTPATFYSLILESTKANKAGTGYKLKERTQVRAPGYFDTELLTFRVVE